MELLIQPQKESGYSSTHQWGNLHVSRKGGWHVTAIKSCEWLAMPSCGGKDPSSQVLDHILPLKYFTLEKSLMYLCLFLSLQNWALK